MILDYFSFLFWKLAIFFHSVRQKILGKGGKVSILWKQHPLVLRRFWVLDKSSQSMSICDNNRSIVGYFCQLLSIVIDFSHDHLNNYKFFGSNACLFVCFCLQTAVLANCFHLFIFFFHSVCR